MVIQIDTGSETPIYEQLRNEIVKGIGRGELEDGESLPTVRALAAELGVNTMTVSKAYQLLKNEGLIETDRRRGAFVRVKNALTGEYREMLSDELELLGAEAKIRGMERSEFMRLCEDAFLKLEG